MDIKISHNDDLRQFATYLHNLGGQMNEEFVRARQIVSRVSENWDDDVQRRFMTDFEQCVEMINRISSVMDQHSAYVNRVCDVADQYKSMTSI